ncbi:nucleotidyltransferase family protein [Sphingomonas sp.]|uniref:nucleotidyltransferase domain-containing protein n=1 Tax=Sphingomonas sp. TaxID=28214 RepID=UPI0025F7E6E9|nr:nucleotidyltransferase family protein [Sphingomonas sp.]
MSGGGASAEFLLLAACCRWPTDAPAIREAGQAAIDWHRFVKLARRHRVQGFARIGLEAAAIAVPPELVTAHRRQTARNLLLLDEAARIAGMLADADIPAAFLKGATLAELAYGDQAVKRTLDNDLLVRPEQVAATIELLAGTGYRLTDPAVRLDGKRLSVLIDMVKECTLVRPDNKAMLDLHWRMTSVEGLLAEPDLTSDLRTVTIGNHRLRTLGDEALMVYLAVHGARHGWSRLKWLADFNALLVAMDAMALASLRARAKRDGVARAMDLALLQANRLFGTPVPDDVGRSRRVRWLATLSDALMRGGDELAEQHTVPRRYMAVGHVSAVLLKSSPIYLANAAWSSWVSTGDALALPLPRAARPLYLLTSPAARIARAARRIVNRGFSRSARSPMRARQEN